MLTGFDFSNVTSSGVTSFEKAISILDDKDLYPGIDFISIPGINLLT